MKRPEEMQSWRSSNTTKLLFISCLCIPSITFSYSDAFNNRHKRIPREHDAPQIPLPPHPNPTSAPTRDPCLPGNNGVHGSLSVNYADAAYKYEIVIESSASTKLENEIIPGIENAIGDRLSRSFVPRCADTAIRRHLPETHIVGFTKLNKSNHRKLILQGITSAPLDQVDNRSNCQSNDPVSECRVVQGGLRFFFNENADRNEINIFVSNALSLIKDDMARGLYTNLFSGVINVSFAQDNLQRIARDRYFDITPSTPIETDEFPRAMSLVVLGAVTACLIFGVLLIGNGNDDIISSYIVADKVDIESHLTDSDVYDENAIDQASTSTERQSSEQLLGSSRISFTSLPEMSPVLGATSSPAQYKTRSASQVQDTLNFFGLTTLLFKRKSSRASVNSARLKSSSSNHSENESL